MSNKYNPSDDMKIDVRRNVNNSGEESPGYSSANVDSAVHNNEMVRMHGSKGYGFAAEQGNDLIDKLHGNDSAIVGNDYKKNGPDRLVNGQYIQTKYYQSASESVAAGFKNKQYQYYDANGNAMPIEVPKDQYEKAVEFMRKRIEAGQVKGHTDPNDAEKLVKKGHLTYQQAKNLAKAGTIESVVFDSIHGVIICSSAFGLTATITFAKSMWDGNDINVAVEESLCAGMQVGGVTFVTSVIGAQLVKAGLNSSLKTVGREAVKSVFRSQTSRQILRKLLGDGTKEAVKNINKAADLICSNIIADAVMFVVLSTDDIIKSFKGRISGKQLFKNMTTLAASLGGGAAGYYIGGSIGLTVGAFFAGPNGGAIGFKIGSIAGSVAGGFGANDVTNKVLSEFIEDDSVAMVTILEKHFVELAQEFLLTQEEVDLALDDLKLALDQFQLLEMFASQDRDKYADDLLRGIIEKIIIFRSHITLPDETAYFEALVRMEERVANGQKILQPQKIDAVEFGRRITRKEIGEREAKKAWYVTKHMNAINMQVENLLAKANNNEINTQTKLAALNKKREQLKYETEILLGE